MIRKYLKPILALLVLLVTIAAFIYYFAKHPAALHQLAHIPPLTLIGLVVLYVVFLVTLGLIYTATLEVAGVPALSPKENLLLTIYSSIVNFFGPLQSGPGFRAVYLKKRYGVKIKNYAIATLLYYVFFAGFSGLFLISGLVGWGAIFILAVLGLIILFTLLRSHLKFVQRFKALHLIGLYKLALATFLQVLTVAIIYFVELKSVSSHVHFSQAIIYSGAANFALFVSLTPGAIGFRESFLLFSKHLHHISSSVVLSASLIDRAIYVVFLGLLFVFAVSIHAKAKLDAKATRE